jgi:hypothetical protein
MAPMSANSSSTSSPTTAGASARMACTHTSVPRPMVKQKPWPSRPGSLVRRIT